MPYVVPTQYECLSEADVHLRKANTVHEKMRNIANCVSSFLETKFNVVNLSIWLYSEAIGNL